MNRKIKAILICLGGLIGLVFLAVAALMVFLDLNPYRPRIEKAASGALKRDVEIRGEIALSLLPPIGVRVHDIHIRSAPGFAAQDLASLESLRVGVEILPLLRKEIRIRHVMLGKPVVYIERDARGRFNFEMNKEKDLPGRKTGKPKETGSALPPLQVNRLTVSKGMLTFLDGKSRTRAGIRDLDLALEDIASYKPSPAKGDPLDLLRGLAFRGTLQAKGIESGRIMLSDLHTGISAANGTMVLDPVGFNILGSAAQGRLTMDLTGKSPVLDLLQEIPRLDLEKATAAAMKEKRMKGSLAVSVRLKAMGFKGEAILKTLTGEVRALGRDLTLYRYDIDTILTQYEKTQNVDLVDLGAVFLAGPLGILLTKGFDAARGYEGLGSAQTTVTRFVSEWQISKGIARAKDVALSTPKNRIAAKGNLDLTRGRFDRFVVAVLAEKGCAKYPLKVEGTFQRPEFEKARLAAGSLTGMFTSLFKKAKDLVVKSECPVFYKGSVPHPAGIVGRSRSGSDPIVENTEQDTLQQRGP